MRSRRRWPLQPQRQLVRGEPVSALSVIIACLTTGLAAAVLLFFAAKLYERDALLFGS